ncbi:Mss4-like protein [Hypoxylon sp. FL0890]|nr:Mss4-like protein [Hypoxylon sp. FL0890]
MSTRRDRRADFEDVEDLGEGIISRPPQVSLSIECLCGGVQGVISGPIPYHQICHCRECKKITGSTHGDFLMVKDHHLIFTRGARTMYSYRVNSAVDFDQFIFRCGECSTPIYVKQGGLQSTRTLVFVGCLVNTEWLDQHKPDAEISVSEKCTWLPKLQGTRTPSPEPDVELVSAEPDIELVRGFPMSASEDSEEDD